MSLKPQSPVLPTYKNGKFFLRFPDSEVRDLTELLSHGHPQVFTAWIDDQEVVLKRLRIDVEDYFVWDDFREFANVVNTTNITVEAVKLKQSLVKRPKPAVTGLETVLTSDIKNSLRAKTWEEVYTELGVHLKFSDSEKDAFIVKCFGFFGVAQIYTDRFLITERCIGSLREIADACPQLETILEEGVKAYPFPIKVIYHLMAPIMDAVIYMHSENWLHRDISDHNIFLSFDGVPKLADFGLAMEFDSSKGELIPWEKKHLVGHESFIAPEIARKEPFNEKIDDWGVIMTMASLMHGGQPDKYGNYTGEKFLIGVYSKGADMFTIQSPRPEGQRTQGQIMVDRYLGFREESWPTQNDEDWFEFRDLLLPFISLEPKKRPNLSELLNSSVVHPYLKQWEEILKGGLATEETKFVKGLIDSVVTYEV